MEIWEWIQKILNWAAMVSSVLKSAADTKEEIEENVERLDIPKIFNKLNRQKNPNNSSEQENEQINNTTNNQTGSFFYQSEFKIFVAHDNKEPDQNIAKEICNFLLISNYCVFSENHIKPSENREARVEKELRECNLFIVLLSSKNTPIQRDKIAVQLSRLNYSQNSPFILPVLVNCEQHELNYYHLIDLIKIEPFKWTKPEDTDILKGQILNLLQEITMSAIAIKINPINPKAKESNFTIDKQILDFIEEGKLCYLLSSPLSATKSKILSEIKIEASSNYHICILDNIKMSYQPTFNEYEVNEYEVPKLWYKKIIDIINQEFSCQCTADQWCENTEKEQLDRLFYTYIEDKIVNNDYIQKVIIIFVLNEFEFKINNYINYIIFKNKFWQLIRQFYLKRNTNQRYEKINFILIDDVDSNQFLINSDIFENSLDKHLFFGWGVNVNNLSFDFMKPKLTKFLKEIDRDKFINAIFDRTKGNELLTQAIVQKAFASRKYISKGEESEFIEEIINELGLRRN